MATYQTTGIDSNNITGVVADTYLQTSDKSAVYVFDYNIAITSQKTVLATPGKYEFNTASRSVSSNVDFLSLTEALYSAYNKTLLFTTYNSQTNTIKTTANAFGMFHAIALEKEDGIPYIAIKKADPDKYFTEFSVPTGITQIVSLASTKIISQKVQDGTVLSTAPTPLTATSTKAEIVSNEIELKPGGILMNVELNRPSYLYAFIRSKANKEIVKIVRSKSSKQTHKLYTKVPPGDYEIEYTNIGD